MSATVHGFQTEVAKLLQLLANSLYSNKEVFLRELISNASDAIDKLHFMALTEPELTKDDPEFKIRVRADKDAKTLTISDNGLGMTLDEANTNLGTIAKSGTEEFVKNLSGDQAKDSQLIGQFGVGFYSAFIVADRVTVLSRSAKVPAYEGVRWTSDGSGTFESENIEVPTRGTQVILHLRDDAADFLDTWKLREAITKYSDHISTPVELYEMTYEEPEQSETAANDEKPTDAAEVVEDGAKEKKPEPREVYKYVKVNDAKALWTRPAKEISEDEYKSFYKHAFEDYSDPLIWSHNKVEGEVDYTSLLYLPSRAPFNIMMRDKYHSIKLYVQRVFIMDEDEQFLPNYLRFVRGLVDTNALPLNVSREILQESKVTRTLKSALTKRALSLIEKLSADKEKYQTFVDNFNDILKEGISDDQSNRERILKLVRFASTYDNSAACHVSLDEYISRMPEKQKHIYFLCADDYDKAVNSPALERLKSKGIEVLLLWKQPIDGWISGMFGEYQGKSFIAANSADLDLGDMEDESEKQAAADAQKEYEGVAKRFKEALGNSVTDVKISTTLGDTPACIVRDGGYSQQMRLMAKLQGLDLGMDKGALEINVKHNLVQKAFSVQDDAEFNKWAKLVFLQATLADQGEVKNPSEFITLMNELLLKDADVTPIEPQVIESEPANDTVEVAAEVVEDGDKKDSSATF